MKETAIERLSKIVDYEEFIKWYESLHYDKLVSDIQEVVALAKKKQQPSIDLMRFEAARTFAAADIYNKGIEFLYDENLEVSVNLADALIAELQKTKQ